jgi:hypothetical protein
MYFENTPSFAERINSELTVFKAFETEALVGFEIKGILPKIKELANMIQITATTPKVHVKLILLICLAERNENREQYQGLVDKSSEFDDAKVPVTA